jgi:hypothetical protein
MLDRAASTTPTSAERVHSLRERAQHERTRRNFGGLIDIGDELERLTDFLEAWRCLSEAGTERFLLKISPGVAARQWHGENKPEARLLVFKLIRHVGAHLRMARVAAQLADETDLRVSICTEPRLVSIFARSFPQIDVYPDSAREQLLAGCNYWASYERVAEYVWKSGDAIAKCFKPLRADVAMTRRLHQRYRFTESSLVGPEKGALDGRATPVVGLSWYSTNERKDLPQHEDWKAFFSEFDCLAISLQYRPLEAGIARFESAACRSIYVDEDVDIFSDLVGFTALVSATDVVVTISNTTAHLAGALGHPCIVLLDDKNHLFWPEAPTCTTDFYPTVTLVRKRGRAWPEVIREAAVKTRIVLQSRKH